MVEHRKVGEGKVIFHVDMDAFYASVEINRNPELKGKSVIVGADPRGGRGRGVVTTASYEARKFGIRSAMPVSQAYKLCPEGIFLPVNMDLYVETSRRVMDILRQFSDKLEEGGIDEAYLDVTSIVKRYGGPEELALAIKKAIMSQEGLTCSIGVAPGKVLAKIASDYQKPDGLTIVEPERLIEFLSPLPVTKIPGVGKKTYERLKQKGIETIGELARVSLGNLCKEFGKTGEWFWSIANGIDKSDVEEGAGVPESMSTERTFDRDTDDFEVVGRTIHDMSQDLEQDLLEHGYLFKTVTLKIRFEDFETFTRSKSLGTYANDTATISGTSRHLLKEFQERGRRVRLVGIKVSNLRSVGGEQQTLKRWLIP